jgi:hypothetical protein
MTKRGPSIGCKARENFGAVRMHGPALLFKQAVGSGHVRYST